MRDPNSVPSKTTQLPLAGSDGRSDNPNLSTFGAQVSSGSPLIANCCNTPVMTLPQPTPMEVSSSPKNAQMGENSGSFDNTGLIGENRTGTQLVKDRDESDVVVSFWPLTVPIAPKKVASGFNYSRAVQGGKGSQRQQCVLNPRVPNSKDTCVPTNPPARLVPGAGPSNPSRDNGFDSTNRFSVLDIPTSIKFSKLVEAQDDLYPPDIGWAENMDVEVNTLNNNGNEDYLPSGKYGISDDQKQVIINCLHDFMYVQAEAVEQWSQGEWDFFSDKCMEMGLDPENSIIYPEEDTEIDDVEDTEGFDSAHAVAHLKKLGSYSDPVVKKAPNRKLLGQRFGSELMVVYGPGMFCSKTRACFALLSRKGKEGKDPHLGGKHATGFEKLNFKDFIQGSDLEQAPAIQQEGSAMAVDLGLSYGDNEIMIATTPYSASPELVGSSSYGLHVSNGLPALDSSNSVHPLGQETEITAGNPGMGSFDLANPPICLMNTNREIPASPARGQFIIDEIMMPDIEP
ncbi:hypothetical protein L1987_10636 [Smallanthus sonchifolius]|uniref:Uncharacterized protein n=1 Tax=Smallanthus sonchifolius TaxID=185202 RepID=A0ACB9JSM7_9ASTR|nr:hypothetical protein L1987_10636 [Smallanthus sonchifolius]